MRGLHGASGAADRLYQAPPIDSLVRELKFARGAGLAAGLRDTLRHALTGLREPTSAA